MGTNLIKPCVDIFFGMDYEDAPTPSIRHRQQDSAHQVCDQTIESTYAMHLHLGVARLSLKFHRRISPFSIFVDMG